ncbi:MAG TPA: Asp-tRNA(Asn)/Glu-tRNA(Gln) amidotransferase subunit GatB [Clostridiales bacterium]|nr:Asp-tRNA(Asn)/Glu-tRNA(Gln) amidotransferase subunit GatB [Clostridiales bacterium]
MKYRTVIGLEIHAELLTKSKAFCTCSAEFGGGENTKVCPGCAGFPGTLPIFNQGAVTLAVKAGLALNCQINKYSVFDRKNYFYPDLPSAYQISQYEYPICTNGYIDIGGKRIRINRIHIEEDAGKLVHDDLEGVSLADYNRSGVPLIEIVTEPDISSAEEAREFVEQVAQRLKYAGVCDAKMEEGSLRCDVNISIMPYDATEFGTRTEIKNLNSFKSIVRAIEYEYQRQCDLLESGKKVIRQTLHFNENHGTTKPLRSKEEAHDYRYFPDADIPAVLLTDEDIEKIKATMPELPDSRIKRYTEEYSLPFADAKLLVSEKALSDFYDEAVKVYPAYKQVSNMVLVELLRRLNDTGASIDELKFTPAQLAELVKLSDEGTVSKNAAKDILLIMFEQGGHPLDIAEKNGFIIKDDIELIEKTADEILAENPKAVAEYKEGSQKVFGFLMGQMFKKIGKSASPQTVKEILNKKLSNL